MENIVKEFSTKRPVAWEQFEFWYQVSDYWMLQFDELPPLVQLTIMQSWLRSINIHAIARFDYLDGIMYVGETISDTGAIHEDYTHELDYETALYAAVDKGCEIFENNKEK